MARLERSSWWWFSQHCEKSSKKTRVSPGTYIVDKVAQTAESQDEKVNLAYQRSLARLILCMEIVANALTQHLVLPR